MWNVGRTLVLTFSLLEFDVLSATQEKKFVLGSAGGRCGFEVEVIWTFSKSLAFHSA